MKQKKPSSLPAGLAFLAVVAATSGALYYQNRRAHGTRIPTTPGDMASPSAAPILPDPLPTVTAEKNGSGAAIFRVVNDESGPRLKRIDAPSGTSPDVEGSLNAMAKEDDSPLPEGTRVLACTESADNMLATVNFNAAFVKNFSGGDTQEALALEAILATVGQFGPHKVQILVEGKKVDSLGGTQSLLEPLPVPQNALPAAATSADTASDAATSAAAPVATKP